MTFNPSNNLTFNKENNEQKCKIMKGDEKEAKSTMIL